MYGINLLPWRLIQYRKKQKIFLIILSLCISLSTTTIYIISIFIEQNNQAFYQAQDKLNKINQELNQVVLQTNQLKEQTQQVEQAQQIPTETIKEVFSFLKAFPLEQGELTQFTLDAEHIIVEGKAHHQTEFENLHQFIQIKIKEQKLFSNAKLLQFKPENNEIYFQFELIFWLNNKGK